jgi:WD40 repeat protein
MRTVLAVSLTLLPLVARAAQPKDVGPPIQVVRLDRKDTVSYEKEIEPILAAKCTTCHAGSVKRGKLDLSGVTGLFKGGAHGPALTPGKSAESLMVRLAGRTAKPHMPPKDEEPLTPQELALLKLWIEQGAKSAGTGEKARAAVVLAPPPETVHPVRAVAVSPDKSAVAAGRGNQIHLYGAAKGEYLKALVDPGLKTADGKPVPGAAHLSLVESLAFSPDGKTLASGGFREVILWDVPGGQIKRRLSGFADRVVALAFSPDGKYLATGGGAPTEDGEIKLFDPADGRLVTDIKNGHSDTVFGVSFSPDGGMLATGAADKFVKVFEVPGGKLLKAFEGHTNHVLDVGWKGDGKFIASAGADNDVKVWDFEKGEQSRTIKGHAKQVTRLVFIGKTPQVLTCSGDQTARVWNVDNGGNVRQFGGGTDFLYAAGVSPDGAVVAVGGEEGVVRLYNGLNGQLIKELLPPGVEVKKK